MMGWLPLDLTTRKSKTVCIETASLNYQRTSEPLTGPRDDRPTTRGVLTLHPSAVVAVACACLTYLAGFGRLPTSYTAEL